MGGQKVSLLLNMAAASTEKTAAEGPMSSVYVKSISSTLEIASNPQTIILLLMVFQ